METMNFPLRCLLIFSVLGAWWNPVPAFEPYDYKTVPFPKGITDFESRVPGLVDTLTDIAIGGDLPEDQEARFLAAARRISPLNRRAFTAEYEKKIGAPHSESRKIAGAQIKLLLEPHLAALSEINGAEEFRDFLAESLDLAELGSPNKSGSSGGSPAVVAEGTIGFLSMDGPRKVKAVLRSGEGSGSFMFAPGGLDSRIFLSAYREAVKFIGLSRGSELVGKSIEFSLDKAVKVKSEGPGAALACAVLTEALSKKLSLEKDTALMGDVNADGTVQPVEDLRERLSSESRSLEKVIIVPKADQFAGNDILLLEGPRVFYKTQLFTVETLSEAVDLGTSRRKDKQKQAIALFTEIQNVLNKPGGAKFITNSHVRRRLQKVLQLAPNHLSAKQLALASQKKYPVRLSLTASLELIFDAIEPIFKDSGEIDSYKKVDEEGIKILSRYRSRIDPALKKLTDAVFTFQNAGRVGSNTANERARVSQRLKEELSRVRRDYRIRERLM